MDTDVAAVQALAANSALAPDVRARRISQAKGQALVRKMGAALAQARTVAIGPWTFSIDSANIDVTTGLVELFGVVVTKDGVDVGLDPHQQFMNPPLLVPDPAGTETARGAPYRVDPAAAILMALMDQADALLAAR